MASELTATLRFHPFPAVHPPGGKELMLITTSKVFRKGDLYGGKQWRIEGDPGWNGKTYEYALKNLSDVIYWAELPDAVALANAAESRPASESCLLEDVLRCRYSVCQSITPSGFGWDTPRLNEVIAAHTANLARPVDEDDFYGIEDAIAQALRDCENEDPDTCSLSPKTLRRLRMALTAARTAPAADGGLKAAWNKVRIEARSISGGRGIGELLVAVEAYGRAVASGVTVPGDQTKRTAGTDGENHG